MQQANKFEYTATMASVDKIDDALRACESLYLGWLPVCVQLSFGGWLCGRFGRRAFG